MNLRSLDLNLLVVFDAIYKERNVTRAAAKLFLTQPAASNALSRLRTHLDDELFLRAPDGLQPTPRAIELAPRLHAILSDLQQALEEPIFDPAVARPKMTIAAHDYFSILVAPSLLEILSREAPGSQVEIVQPMGNEFDDLDRGEIDFTANAFFDKIPERFDQARLLEDRYFCLVRKDHPLVRLRRARLSQYAKASHLLVSPRGGAHGFVDDELVKLGLRRHIGLVVNNFGAAPPIVAQSDLVLTAPSRVLKQLMTSEHVMFDCPVNAPVEYCRLELVWHKVLSRHPGPEWLRSAICRAAEEAAAA